MAGTWYLTDTNIVAATLEQLSDVAPSTADASQGWTVGTKATPNFSPYRPDTTQAAASFVTTEPSAFSQIGYRTNFQLLGTYSDANWVLSFKVTSGTTYYAQTGQVKFRLWRSVNANGSSATQITPGWQASSTISFTAANQSKSGTITWTPGSTVVLTSEYLFLEIEWSAIVSGGNAAAAVKWVHNDGLAKLDTPDYVVSAIITQDAAEILESNNPNALATQDAVEILESNNPNAFVTQNVVEVLIPSYVYAVYSQAVVEVLIPYISPVQKQYSAWGWGYNGLGELGDGTITNKSSPVSVLGNHSFVQITLGAALKIDGTVWAWGYNTNGELGDGTNDNKSSPVSVLGNHSFIQISHGRSNIIALKGNGTCWTWGNNANGELGDGTNDNKSSPISVIGDHTFIFVDGADKFSIGLKGNGEIWGWGDSGGLSVTRYGSSPVLIATAFMAIAVGGGQCLALKDDGTCWAWGANGSGELGDGTSTDRSSPVSVLGNHSFIQIEAGSTSGLLWNIANASMGLKANGEIWTWGGNLWGNLGCGDFSNRSSPVLVIGNHSFIQVGSGLSHVAALKSNGEIWSWGAGSYGELGNNTSTFSDSSPVLVTGGYSFTEVMFGGDSSQTFAFQEIPSILYNLSIPINITG